MKKTPKAFLSTLIAQKFLSGNGSEGSTPQCSKIATTLSTKECKNTISNISQIPTFHKVKEEELYTDYGLPLSEIVATFARKAKTVYERMLISERGQELLSKSEEYEIPYDLKSIDWLKLMDDVEEYEEVIEQAAKYGIDWNNFGYDVIGLQQEIEEAVLEENSYQKDVHSYFLSTRGVEV